MNRSILSIIVPLLLIILIAACQRDDDMSMPMQSEMQDSGTSYFLPKVGRGMIWADGYLYGTIATPATFKGDKGPYDELYVSPGFKDGIGAISEAKPGDQDFNGGRWHVNALKDGVDPGKYSGSSSVEELDLNDFASTETYFECPLLPMQN